MYEVTRIEKNMKFKMSLLSLAMLSNFAFAQTVSMSYGIRDSVTGSILTSTGLSVSNKLTDKISGDVGISNLQDRVTNTNGLRYEVGITYSESLTSSLSGSVRVSHGFKTNSGKDTIQYYNIEPSVTAKISSTPLLVRVGYRYRNAYDVSDSDRSDTSRVSVRYQVTKKDIISLGYDEQRGSGAAKQTTLGYSRSF
jgi:hypothetical protein